MILNTYFNNIGEAGQAPQFIYIDTNNTIPQLALTGYLNDLVSQGIPLSDKMMALVSSKTSPSDKHSQTALYGISFSNGNWSLIPNSSPVTLPDDNFFIGSSSNFAIPRQISGDITINNTGVSALDPNLRPEAIIKYFGTFNTAGGSTTEVFPVVGLAGGIDIGFAVMGFPNAANAIIRTVNDSVDNQLTITFSADPGPNASVNFQVIRTVFS